MSNIIVMAFSPRNIVGCFLNKRLTKGGETATPGPPSLHPCFVRLRIYPRRGKGEGKGPWEGERERGVAKVCGQISTYL